MNTFIMSGIGLLLWGGMYSIFSRMDSTHLKQTDFDDCADDNKSIATKRVDRKIRNIQRLLNIKYWVGTIFIIGLLVPASPWFYLTLKDDWASHKAHMAGVKEQQYEQEVVKNPVYMQCFNQKLKEARITPHTNNYFPGMLFYDGKDTPRLQQITSECIQVMNGSNQ